MVYQFFPTIFVGKKVCNIAQIIPSFSAGPVVLWFEVENPIQHIRSFVRKLCSWLETGTEIWVWVRIRGRV